MTIDRKIKETVAMAKVKSLAAFKAFSEAGEVEVQSKEEAGRIIRENKWLQANFKKVQVNAPGTRKRMGWSKEAIDAMSKEPR